MDKILKEFGINKIKEIVKESKSFVDATKKLGLIEYQRKNVERSIKRLGLSVEHFESIQRVREYKNRYKKDVLQKLVEDGKNFKQILEHLDILPVDSNYRTLKKYLKLFEIDFSHLENKRNYIKGTWKKENLENIVKTSKSQKETLEKLGLRSAGSNFKTLKKYIDIYGIDVSHFTKNYDKMVELNKNKIININDVLIEKSSYNRVKLKNRLYNEGLKKRKCELCEQGEEWKGKHMSLILDHINGIYNDNRLENLRIVCPNCNATLETHCRGVKNKK